MALQEYRRKRHFNQTPEPAGSVAESTGWSFVVQKHDATRLHYDFRLELEGVLKSWAVPKGPSLDPAEKRLAVQVEDHPLEYGGFEGIIPEHEYGGGTVIVWDRGTWSPVGDAQEGYAAGKLKFQLQGEKLRGGWTLVCTRAPGAKPDHPHWLLIKERDDEARPHEEFDVTAELLQSVATGRTIDDVASARDRVWTQDGEVAQNGTTQNETAQAKAAARRPASSNPKSTSAARRASGRASKSPGAGPASRTKTSADKSSKSKPATKRDKTAEPSDSNTAEASLKAVSKSKRGAKTRAPRSGKGSVDVSDLPGARAAALPAEVTLQLATLVESPPDGPDWIHEIKFDGYRLLVRLEDGQPRLITRGGQDWTDRFVRIAETARQLPFRNALFDGEVVALESNGISSFQALQNVFRSGRGNALFYQVFDVLYLDGYDLRGVPLLERKQVLQTVCESLDAKGSWRLTEHVAGHGSAFFQACCHMGLEGIISKRFDRPHRSGRSEEWLKSKCIQREEFVIGGFTDSTASRRQLGALLVGYHDPDGRLIYGGKVGTGFSEAVLTDLRQRLVALEQSDSPFADHSGCKTGVHWVRPELVAQVEFTSWTDDRILRHPSFQGLREDKPAENVTREVPAETPIASNSAASGSNRSGSPRAAQRSQRGKTPAASTSASKTPPSARESPQMTPPKKTTSPAATASAPHEASPDEFAGVRLTHPDKVLYPGQGVTKAGLAEYYLAVADHMLPHVTDRPLSLVRCPEGQRKACFYQKHVGPGTPRWLRHIPIQESGKVGDYVVIDDVAGLVALVQMGVLEIHPWGSRSDNVERPDRLIFDLDPDAGVPWTQTIAAARQIRELLAGIDLQSFVKTTGGKGLHIYVPLQRRLEWDELKQFARDVAAQMMKASPELFTINPLKATRKNKIYLDYLRNERGATAVAPYSTRAREGATVSTPLAWDELGPAMRADHFHVGNVPARLASLKFDPWSDLPNVKQTLTATARREIQG